MAKGDIVAGPIPARGFGVTSLAATIAAPDEGALVLFAVSAFTADLDEEALPFGAQVIKTKYNSSEVSTRYYLVGKVCDGTEGTSWVFEFSGSTNCIALPLQVDGPFSTLEEAIAIFDPTPESSALTVTGSNPIAVLADPIPDVATAVRAIAVVFLPYPSAGAGIAYNWTNGFTALPRPLSDDSPFPPDEPGTTMVRWASRTFAADAEDIQTTCELDPSASPYGWKLMLLVDLSSSGGGTPALSIDEQPTATQSGYLIDPAPVVHVLDAEDALDTTFTGNVTATLLGSGVLLGTTTVAAVAGVATFSNLRPCEAGSYQLRFSASGYANLDSDVFAVTAGEGSTVIIYEEAPMRPIRRNEPTANQRDIPITILASDGSPWDGDPDEGDGIKAEMRINNGTMTPSPANIVKIAPGEFYVRPTDTYVDVAEGSIITAIVPAAAGRRMGKGRAHIIPADSYVNADAARKLLVDAIVLASDGGGGYAVTKLPESNQIQRTIPDVGVFTITATFSPTVPGLVSAGGS